MRKDILYIITGLVLGVICGFGFIFYSDSSQSNKSIPSIPNVQIAKQKKIIGFLPYWLLARASSDYSIYITQLSYFALHIDHDGTIQKLTNPQQEEPGWYQLDSGNVDKFFNTAKGHNVKLSLVIDSGDTKTIDSFVSSPSASADNLVSNVLPVMKKYGFSDLNLDIEYTQTASETARKNFVTFVKTVRDRLPTDNTLTLEISPVDAIQQRLIDISKIVKYVNDIVLMAYDYHAPDSFVTGPIAPLNGAGTISEYDVSTAVEKTIQQALPQKIILGIPLYGYEWETIGNIPRSAVIPGSGVIASNRRVEEFLANCATCSAKLDQDAFEYYVSYNSTDTNTNHIIFFPNTFSTTTKIDFANKMGLNGVALWALGYEGNTMLSPLEQYKTSY